MYKLIYQNANLIDGTGKPAFVGNLAVDHGKIVMNPDLTQGAEETVDAKGLVLCPGFIDAHSHGDEVLGNFAACLCKTSQGITTEATGQCGETMFPVSQDPEKRALLADMMAENLEEPYCGYKEIYPEFTSFRKFLDYAESRKTTTNYTILTGHSALRIAAMGFDNRKPTRQEMETMKTLLRDAMEHGSKGLSTGLLYSPGSYSEEDELVELCKIVAEYDGFYATHLRNEAGDFLEAVREAISIAERSGCRLNLSHHKVCGRDNWGKSEQSLQMIQDAVHRGVRVVLDVYPYTASMTFLNVCLPAAFFSHGQEKMAQLLREPQIRAQLKEEILQMDGRYRQCGDFDHILVVMAPNTPDCMGKTVEAYAKELGIDPFDAYFDIVADNGQRAQAVYFSMDEADLRRIVCDERAMLGTDGIVHNMQTPTHPRAFGSFTKALRCFVREEGLLTMEQMIHKMTGQTAKQLCIENKGELRDGYDADLVLLNPDTVADRADFINSTALSDGILQVVVAGEIVYRDGALTGKYPGKFIPHKKDSHILPRS